MKKFRFICEAIYMITKGSLISVIIFMNVGIIIAATSCAPVPREEEWGEYLWPLPPAEPKIRYVKSLWGAMDIQDDSLVRTLFGKDQSAELFKPYGVTTDKKGRLYVTDTVRKVVFVFDEKNNRMNFLGVHSDKFMLPAGVTVDEGERIYISDTGYDEVLVFSGKDSMVSKFGEGILHNPSGMEIDDEKNRIYVVSTKSHRVEVFTLDGEHLFGFGGRGKAPGKFNYPMDVAIDSSGNLYVVDSANFRIQIFTSDGSYLRELGAVGSNPGQFARPKGIAIDRDDIVYVTDAAFNNFQMFDSEGRLLLYVGYAGMYEPGAFSLPADIFVDENNLIYVADQLNRRVQVFQKLQ
jgi:DNA-binding beta-propeller fold protein YncE